MDQRQSNVEGGKLLANWRTGAKLTQVELAKRAGISRSMVAQLEIGERRPSRQLISKLCRALGSSADQERNLLVAYDFSPSGETPDQIATFLRADKNLSDEQASQIASLVREAYEKAIMDESQTEE